MERKKIRQRCLCGRDVFGFTPNHVKANMSIHEKNSRFHRDVLAAVKRLRGKRLP